MLRPRLAPAHRPHRGRLARREGPRARRRPTATGSWPTRHAPPSPTGPRSSSCPTSAGCTPYYRDLALRFAEHGTEAIAIDYFGRTAGIGDRGPGLRLPAARAADDVRRACAPTSTPRRPTSASTTDGNAPVHGRLLHGRPARVPDATGFGLGLAGVIGFYGWPTGAARNGTPAPADVAATFEAPVLGLFGGADEGINAEVRGTFETALPTAGVPHKLVTYDKRAALVLRPQGGRVRGHVGAGVGRGPRLHPRRPRGVR